jgi:hypothetical protein
MGEIESVKVGKAWRLSPEAVAEYDKRLPEIKNRKPSGYFIYSGNSGVLFSCIPDSLPPDPQGENTGVERRRGQLVHRKKRSPEILLDELKPVVQLELLTA